MPHLSAASERLRHRLLKEGFSAEQAEVVLRIYREEAGGAFSFQRTPLLRLLSFLGPSLPADERRRLEAHFRAELERLQQRVQALEAHFQKRLREIQARFEARTRALQRKLRKLRACFEAELQRIRQETEARLQAELERLRAEMQNTPPSSTDPSRNWMDLSWNHWN